MSLQEQVRGKSELYIEEVRTKTEKKKKQKRRKRDLFRVECGHHRSHGKDDWIPSAECKVQFCERYYQNVTGTGLCAFCNERYVLLTNYSD
jgi:hypothetical protein